MEITSANIYQSTPRSRSRSRTRNSTANSRSTSSTRRPSLGPQRRSLSSSSLSKLIVTSTQVESSQSSDGSKSIPTTSATLDNTLPIDFFKQDLISLIKALRISKWHKHNLELMYLSINRISGALTNSIYKLEYKDPHTNGLVLPSLLLRVYGKNVDSIIDRDSELKTLIKLLQKKIGPRLLGIFANGRFEQFLEGYITLDKQYIRNEVISQMIARRMKDLHSKIQLEQHEIESENEFDMVLPMSWRLIYKWLDLLEEQLEEARLINPDFKEEDIFFQPYALFRSQIEEYKEWLFAKYDLEKFSDNFRFCHNDTQYGNLLLHESFNPDDIVVRGRTLDSISSSKEDTSQEAGNVTPVIKETTNKQDHALVVIDFEYGGSNFPAFDLVNHFSEWMSDYHSVEKSYFIHNEKYPTKLEQLNLIKSYIEYDFQIPLSNLILQSGEIDVNQITATELIELEIKKLYNECILWRPTVQIYWTLWGLIQNGPFVKSANIGLEVEEEGIDGKYNITTAIDSLQLEDDAQVEDITSSDDDFSYLKYSQQKIALILGDLIQFGLLKKEDINESYVDEIKWLDTELFEI